MSFTGIKSAGTILGSHEWQLDKLENFTITFWEKPTFKFSRFETFLFATFFFWHGAPARSVISDQAALLAYCALRRAANLQLTRRELKKIQTWLDFKGHRQKSLSLDDLAFIKGQITAGS